MDELSALENRIREFIHYDHERGELTWKKKPNRNIRLGSKIGRPNCWGHFKFGLLGKTLMVHRVAWFLHYGKWPEHQIDHMNGDKSDNRICNLRDVPQNQNMQNIYNARKDSSSGLLGAYRNPNSSINPWESSIKFNKKRFYIGRFPTAEEAHKAYMEAKSKYHDMTPRAKLMLTLPVKDATGEH